MMEALLVVVTFWAILGFFGGVFVCISRFDEVPHEEAVAAGLITFILFPLVLLFKVIPFIWRGFAGLYRARFPAKVKLPKAQVL